VKLEKLLVFLACISFLSFSLCESSRFKGLSEKSCLEFYGVEFVEDLEDPEKGLDVVSRLGLNLVLECFYDWEGVEGWNVKLESFRRRNIRVIAWLIDTSGSENCFDGWFWSGDHWEIKEVGYDFLVWAEEISGNVNHRYYNTLFAVFGLEEPYWTTTPGGPFTTAQLQELYRKIKSVAPHVKIYSELSDMDAFDRDGWRGGAFGAIEEYKRFDEDDLDFADGVADYAGIWFYPFIKEYEGESPTSYVSGASCASPEDCLNRVVDVIIRNKRLVEERAPNTKLVFVLQAFGGGIYRMPSPSEMRKLARTVVSLNCVSGVLWYFWDNPCPSCEYTDWLSRESGEYWSVIREFSFELIVLESVRLL